jgi:nicotinamidase/pyrazinamidase
VPKNIQLLIIDPQRSFCASVPADQQQFLHDGELCVPGAWDDMVRLSKFIARYGGKLTDIHVTLDSHQTNHIAHPAWFTQVANNAPVSVFTAVSLDGDQIVGQAISLKDGSLGPKEKLRCAFPGQHDYTVRYLQSLVASKRYGHTIWPPHCLIGTVGATVVEPLFKAMNDWCEIYGATVNFVTKGSNPRCEHFSAVVAEVPDPMDPGTQINTDFIKVLMECDELLLSGEALSHCVANTIRDVANCFASGGAAALGANDEFIRKCVLLKDATSSVPGFDAVGNAFIDEMVARGMRVSTTEAYFA